MMVAKKTVKKIVKKSALVPVLDRTTTKDQDIQKSPLEDLIQWRDTASNRVSKADSEKKKLIQKLYAIEKKTHSDIRWIKKLNNVLSDRVFSQQKHRGERVLVNISKEIMSV